MSDLKEIKKRILKEDKIPLLLEKMGCEFIALRNNRYEAQRPGGHNQRSVQVYISDSLPCRVRSKGQNKIDIFGLVSFIVYDKKTEDEQSKNLSEAKKWICNQLGYIEYIHGNYKPKDNPDYNSWLHSLKKKRKRFKSINDIEPNKIIDEAVLNQFVQYPHMKWVKEGLSCETQHFFQIGFDIQSERIVFPVHNEHGELIGVKGRYIGTDEEIEKRYKYMYLIACNKSIELFNLHRAKSYIEQEKKIIIFEGAKSTFRAWQYGFRNTVSIEGDAFDDIQIQKIKNLGMDIEIYYMADRDKTKEEILQQAKRITNRNVYALWDKEGLLGEPGQKKSPTDLGKEIFCKLYTEHMYKISDNKSNMSLTS